MIPKTTWVPDDFPGFLPKKQRQPRLKDPLQSSIQLLRPASRGGNHLDVILPGNAKMRLDATAKRFTESNRRQGVDLQPWSEQIPGIDYDEFVTLEAEIKRNLACSFHAHITAS